MTEFDYSSSPAGNVQKARKAMVLAEAYAREAWALLSNEERSRGSHRDAARAQAASRLPNDVREFLKIDRYGSSK